MQGDIKEKIEKEPSRSDMVISQGTESSSRAAEHNELGHEFSKSVSYDSQKGLSFSELLKEAKLLDEFKIGEEIDDSSISSSESLDCPVPSKLINKVFNVDKTDRVEGREARRGSVISNSSSLER
jgi:hypothetical protein